MSLPEEVLSAFPSLRPPWPAQLVAGTDGRPRWGTWDPTTGEVAVADPGDDPRLPGLARWVGAAEIAAYRPGWRAVVRVDGERWVEVVRVPRTAEVVDRYRALDAMVSATDCPLVVPEVLECDERAGIVVLSAVDGMPLHQVCAGPSADDALVEVGLVLARLGAPGATEVLGTTRAGAPLRAAVARQPLDWATIAGGAVGDDALASELMAVARRLSGDAPPHRRDVVVHGDLDDRNLLLGSPSQAELLRRWPAEPPFAVRVVDLDAAGVGEPGRDVATLACHLVLRSLIEDGSVARGRAQTALLLDAFVVSGGDATETELRWWQARTFFRLACVHLFRRATSQHVPALLDLTTTAAGG